MHNSRVKNGVNQLKIVMGGFFFMGLIVYFG